ncbi:hypothetical protein R5R35_000643 [Gryllus longicercus]|uniref:Integrase catalytic domain-containing protein n=1 Tax=Gryllus longicercus TaxID=2509291 RepID=A0AAN9Z9U2_9ORTH
MDIFQFEKKEYLLIVDLYSKYPEVAQLRNMSSESVVNECKAVFARHGKPEKVYSDNGTNFVSREIRNFAKEWEFECTTSSAGYSQSNEFIERHVQTIKNLLQKSLKDNKDIYLTLLEYRNTPLDSNSPSPAQLSFNRRLRSMLPYTDKLLKPLIQKDIVIKAQNKQYIQKYYYDKQAKDLVPLQVGDRVLLQTDKRNWKPGVVRETMSRPRSYKVELESGSVLERNRRFLRKDSAVVVDKNRYNDISENNVDNEENVEIDDSVSSPTSEANVKVDKVITNDNSPNNVNAENIVVDHSNERNIVKSSPVSRPKRITKKPSYLNDYTM